MARSFVDSPRRGWLLRRSFGSMRLGVPSSVPLSFRRRSSSDKNRRWGSRAWTAKGNLLSRSGKTTSTVIRAPLPRQKMPLWQCASAPAANFVARGLVLHARLPQRQILSRSRRPWRRPVRLRQPWHRPPRHRLRPGYRAAVPAGRYRSFPMQHRPRLDQRAAVPGRVRERFSDEPSALSRC